MSDAPDFLTVEEVHLIHEERLYGAMIGLAERRLDKPGLAALLRKLASAAAGGAGPSPGSSC